MDVPGENSQGVVLRNWKFRCYLIQVDSRPKLGEYRILALSQVFWVCGREPFIGLYIDDLTELIA